MTNVEWTPYFLFTSLFPSHPKKYGLQGERFAKKIGKRFPIFLIVIELGRSSGNSADACYPGYAWIAPAPLTCSATL
jgi:hypothetical protein